MILQVKQIKIYVGDQFQGLPLSNYQARIQSKSDDADTWSSWIDSDERNIFYFSNLFFLEVNNIFNIQLRVISTGELIFVNNLNPVSKVSNKQVCISIQFDCTQFRQDQFK